MAALLGEGQQSDSAPMLGYPFHVGDRRAADLPHLAEEDPAAFDGSISAEHGLGQSERDSIAEYEVALDLELMRGVKRLFDPAGLMNPGKVLPG